jgi:hypothetical protein
MAALEPARPFDEENYNSQQFGTKKSFSLKPFFLQTNQLEDRTFVPGK